MNQNTNKLAVIDSETLLDTRLAPTKFCVDTLLPEGLCILGGAPKIGKSWMVLDLCVRVAKGEDIWNLRTRKGTVLYLCLEDSHQRIKNRLNTVTNEGSCDLYFATESKTMADGLCDQIREFYREHPDIVLVAIDTFQLIRDCTAEASYAGDYQDMQVLKHLAEELHITILLVHHLRKLGDSDPLNKISGTTGLVGAADATWVLEKSKRASGNATLFCTGRDIENREMEFSFDRNTCTWKIERDSLTVPEMLLPPEMEALVSYARSLGSFHGGNTEFTDTFNAYAGLSLSVKGLKQMMNTYQFALEENGVFFESRRSNGKRYLSLSADLPKGHGAVSDGNIPCGNECVPSVPVTEDTDSGCPERTRISRGEQSARLAAHIGENGQKPEPTFYESDEDKEGVTQYA